MTDQATMSDGLPTHRPGKKATLAVLSFVMALLAMAAVAQGQRPEFRMSVAPQELNLGDTVTLTVSIDMAGLAGPDRYWHPSFKEFKLVDSQIKRGTQTRIDPKVGQQLRTVEVYRYILEPTQTGRLVIESAKIRVGAEEWESKSQWVRVRASNSPISTTISIGHTDAAGLGAPGYVPPKAGGNPDAFLYAVADRKTAWVGEQITVSWLLFTRSEILKYEPTPPPLAGLWSELLFEPSAYLKYSDARIGSKDYLVTLVSKRALFATSAGPFTISPFKAKIATIETALGRTQSLTSNALAIEVNALPDNAPKGFDSTYVGQYSVSTSVDRDLLQAGESLTLSLRVRGTGAVGRTRPPRLQLPDISFDEPRDFEYQERNRGDVVAGERTYRFWATPAKGGEQTLPAIEVPYFDPAKGLYQVARSVPIGFTVDGEPAAAAALLREKNLGNPLVRDIRLLRDTKDIDSRVLAHLYRQSWFWFLLLLPPLIYLGIVIADRLRRRLTKETPRGRLRRARGIARGHFQIAEIHLRGGRHAKYFAALSHAIDGYLAEWLGTSLQSMTREEMQDFLLKRGIAKAIVMEVLESLETFDFARFAPSEAGPDEMRAAMDKTKKLLARVEAGKRGAA